MFKETLIYFFIKYLIYVNNCEILTFVWINVTRKLSLKFNNIYEILCIIKIVYLCYFNINIHKNISKDYLLFYTTIIIIMRIVI